MRVFCILIFYINYITIKIWTDNKDNYDRKLNSNQFNNNLFQQKKIYRSCF